MLDVHAPHTAVHGWRDFLIHIATISIGLLIALSLEAGVEALHNRHIVREARENIRQEVEANHQLLVTDRRYLDSNSNTLRQDIVLLTALKQNPRQLTKPEIHFPWAWNSPVAAAWDTARNTGALALMPYDDAQGFALTYGQQQYVNEQAILYINHHHAIEIPLQSNPDLSTLTPAQIDEMIHACATTLADIQYLEELMKDLDSNYTGLLHA